MKGGKPEVGVIDLGEVIATLERNRKAREEANRCDGNHGGPPCADPECWARDDDDVTPLAHQLCLWP